MRSDVLSGCAAAALTLGLALATGSASAAPVIQNGSFDTLVPSNGTGGGWTSSNIDGSGGYVAGDADNFQVNNLSGYFILNDSGGPTDPTLTQLIDGFVIGGVYKVTGQYEAHFGDQNDAFGVDIVEIANSLLTFDWPGSGVGAFESTFTATATSHTLRLRAEINGTDTSYGVDSIAIQTLREPDATPAPEPAALGLFALGLAGLGLRRRRAA